MNELTSIPPCFLSRANKTLSLDEFNRPPFSSPVKIGNTFAQCPYESQYLLRMMVRSPSSEGFKIPRELHWLSDTIHGLDFIQKSNGLNNKFVYITVRHGIVTSETDDEWHVDGFSMRVPHAPEQNYICSSINPTEFLVEAIPVPKEFNPFKHNLHTFFQKAPKTPNSSWQCEANKIYLIDPYCIHRRPKQTNGTFRTFWRISFLPIEIEDDTCTQNPLNPIKTYNKVDIRQNLIDFPG